MIDYAKPPCLDLQLHFIIVEVTRNIPIYELEVLYVFYIDTVCPDEICEFIEFLIWRTSMIVTFMHA